MSITGLPAFDATVHKTNEVLHAVEEACGWGHERREHSYQLVRAVLHALRDRLTVDEAADLAAQLPMLLRGIFFEGWVPARVPMKLHRDEVLARVRSELSFDIEDDTEQLVTTVLESLRRFVTDGEWDDIAAVVPKDLRELLPTR